MKKFILHGEMRDLFGESVCLDVLTMREFVDSMSANYKGFRKFFIQKSLAGVQHLFVDTKNIKLESYCADIPLIDKEYNVLPSVQGAAMMGVIQNFAMGWGMQKLQDELGDIVTQDPVPEYEIITTNSFIYSDNENRTEQGAPIPVVYGQLRVGSKVIQSSIDNYDYNYDEGYIYDTPKRSTSLYDGLKYSFVDPSELEDLRDSTDEAINTQTTDSTVDSSKRSATKFAGGETGPKEDTGEVAATSEFDPGSQTSSNPAVVKQVKYGPSAGSVSDGKAPWWNTAKAIGDHLKKRPSIFASNGQIDYNVRPSSQNTLSVARIQKAGAENNNTQLKCLSWRDGTPMTVGTRGNYQKLESIGIYKTLEILSEGPIAGLALPITGTDKDNGSVTYPYTEGDATFSASSNKIILESVTFNSTHKQFRPKSNPNTRTLIIQNPGSDYTDGSYVIPANQNSNNIDFRFPSPSSSSTASISDILFEDPSLNPSVVVGGGNIISTNQLFILDPDDGRVTFNEESSYFSNNKMDLAGLDRDSETLGIGFSMGAGYSDPFTVTLEPDSSPAEIEINLGEQTTTSRTTQATIYDINNQLGSQVFGSTFEKTFNNLYLNSTNDTLPNTNQTWDVLPRIFVSEEFDDNALDTEIIITLIESATSAGQKNTITLELSFRDYITGGNAKIVGTNNITTTNTRYHADKGLLDGFIYKMVNMDPNYRNSATNNRHPSFPGYNSGVVNFNYQKNPKLYNIDEYSDNQAKGDTRPFYLLMLDLAKNGLRTKMLTADGMPVNILKLMGASARLNNDVVNAFESSIGSLKTLNFNHNGKSLSSRKLLKFTVGSGSVTPPGEKTNFICDSTLESGLENFDSIAILDNGSIPEDIGGTVKDAAGIDYTVNARGLYNPNIYPRVTLYSLRKTIMGSITTFEWLPTNIDCVAEVNPKGTIEKLHLLRVPDLCVYSKSLEKFTPLCPYLPSSNANPFGGQAYYDLGICCIIDPSRASTSIDLSITADDGLSLVDPSVPTASYKFRKNWSDHLVSNMNTMSVTSTNMLGAGFYQNTSLGGNPSRYYYNNPGHTPFFAFTVNPTASYATPTQAAIVHANLETINLDSGDTYLKTSIENNYFAAEASESFICTGRPVSMSIKRTGSGYRSSDGKDLSGKLFNFSLFPQSFEAQFANVNSAGSGYRPNDTFYLYGCPRRHVSVIKDLAGFDNESIPDRFNFYQNLLSMINLKLKVTTSSTGQVSNIEVIDKGFDFSSENDLVLLNQSGDEIFTLVKDLFSAGYDSVGGIGHFNPNDFYSKQNLIIEVDNNDINENARQGSISKFSINQEGLGFNCGQLMSSIFSSQTIVAPTLELTIAGGSATSAVIKNEEHTGYSVTDKDLNFAMKAPPPAESIALNTAIETDPSARFRSIFLNDSPIRDRFNRFNYSKFHFDMRIGNFPGGNSGTNSVIDLESLLNEVRSPIMSSEFKMPSHTTMIDYRLYGPRNQGEKEYYYAYTIRNSEISAINIAIRIDELHYLYEGDEVSTYINLIPIIAVTLGITAGTMLAQAIAGAFVPDPTMDSAAGMGRIISGTGTAMCGFAQINTGITQLFSMGAGATAGFASEGTKAGLIAAFLAGLLGLLAGYIISKIFTMIVDCDLAPFLCWKMGEIIKNSGEIWPAKCHIAIEYGLEGEEPLVDIIEIAGCATNPYVKDILIDNLPSGKNSLTSTNKNRIIKIYRITREMDPLRGSIVEWRYKIKTAVHSITEFVNGFFNYPNTAIVGTRVNSKDHPSAPKREYLIKGRLIKIPNNYNPTESDSASRYSSELWNGQFRIDWTSNPAWIIYDLLTNKTYGMGKHGVKEDDVDRWSFYEFAQYCDEPVATIVDGVSVNERRHMCNLYVDSEREAYTYIKELLSIYNSTLNFASGKIYISTDLSVSSRGGSVMLFNNNNISEEGFSYSSTPATKRITAATVDFLDERDNYTLKSEYVEDDQGIRENGYSHIKIAGQGITRRGEANRLAWQKILSFQMEKDIINFKTGLPGSYIKVGDVISVLDNNKIAKHSGGSVVRIVSNNVIELDIPAAALSNVSSIWISGQESIYSNWDGTNITYNNGDTVYSKDGNLYVLHVTELVASGGNLDPSEDFEYWSLDTSTRESQYKEFSFSNPNGFQITLGSNINGSINKGSLWMIKENNTDEIKPSLYRVKKIRELEGMSFDIAATEYVESKYNYIDSAMSSDQQSLDEYYGHNITV